MIGRGKHGSVYLYEVTEQDLLLDDSASKCYSPGNVLLFADRRCVGLGAEFAFAEDLAAAREYLDQRAAATQAVDAGSVDAPPPHTALPSQEASLPSAVLHDESLKALTEKIEQRDGLLSDLAESLETQRQDNELLLAQLERARTQLAVDELRHNELVGDLQHVSEETHTIETAFERVMDEKFRLEQELAERITELVELSLQNDDLKKRLVEPAPESGSVRQVAKAPDKGDAPSSEPALNGLNTEQPEVVTTASGKQIHILHEFPTSPKQEGGTRGVRLFMRGLRFAMAFLLALAVLLCASTVATARANDISYGAALDLITKGFDLP
jgi:regulator of replication initiation timing